MHSEMRLARNLKITTVFIDIEHHEEEKRLVYIASFQQNAFQWFSFAQI